ncbi:MAG: hypothetical protein WCT10_03670 [Patescibacteria group bacterium]|jgi:hypothetical protein
MVQKKSEFVSAAGTTFEIIQKLSGAVRDLGGSDDHLRRILSDEELRREIAKLLVAGTCRKTLGDMLKACGNDWANSAITEEHFPVKPELFTVAGTKVFHFNRIMTTKEVEAAIRAKGYEPASIETLLAYGVENPREQRKHPIVALGSSWVHPGGSREVPCLCEYDRKRQLRLWYANPKNYWCEDYCFLASRKSSMLFVADPQLNVFDQMIEDCKFVDVDHDINEQNFPLAGPVVDVSDMLLVSQKDFGSQGKTFAQIKTFIDSEGYRCATLAELIDYAKAKWDDKDAVIALGSFWVDQHGHRVVPRLYRGVHGPGLDLLDRLDDLSGISYSFLVVRK